MRVTAGERVVIPANLKLSENITIEGACDHDWRVNPVVVATTPTGDCELWTCATCRTQRAGPRVSGIQSKHPVHPFDPTTWEHRHVV